MFKYVPLLMALLYFPASYAQNDDIRSMLNVMDEILQDEERYQNALEAGAERAALCVHCHGEDGNSKRAYIPNLAQQNAEYLFTQFEYFANGTRKDYVMSKLAQGLTTRDKIAVALYFSEQQVKAATDAPVASEKGAHVYNTVCFACHGREGYGDAQYPRIAGQPYEFLEKTLKSFHRNADERKDSIMAGIVKGMTEQQLLDVAAHVANMK